MASRSAANARVRSSSACRSATSASSTSVLVATPARYRSPSDALRFGGAAHAVLGGGDRGARRVQFELALLGLRTPICRSSSVMRASTARVAAAASACSALRRPPSQSVHETLTPASHESSHRVDARKNARIRPRVVEPRNRGDLRLRRRLDGLLARARRLEPLFERSPLGPLAARSRRSRSGTRAPPGRPLERGHQCRPISRRRSASATSRLLRASIASSCWRERWASAAVTSFGGMSPCVQTCTKIGNLSVDALDGARRRPARPRARSPPPRTRA